MPETNIFFHLLFSLNFHLFSVLKILESNRKVCKQHSEFQRSRKFLKDPEESQNIIKPSLIFQNIQKVSAGFSRFCRFVLKLCNILKPPARFYKMSEDCFGVLRFQIYTVLECFRNSCFNFKMLWKFSLEFQNVPNIFTRL